MASKVAKDNCNTETEEGTIVLQKKRSRRVSFSEITSVHVFDRDDDYETSPDPKLSSGDLALQQSDEGLGFHRDSTDGEDYKEFSQNENNDDREFDVRRSFLRPIESPPPPPMMENEEPKSAKVGSSSCNMSTVILCGDQPVKLMAAADLPSQFTWSGEKTQKNLLISEDTVEGMIVTSGTDSLSAEIMLDHVKCKKATITPHEFVPAPGKNMEKKSLA